MSDRLYKFFSHHFFDYFIVYILIATSGIMFFYKNEEHVVLGFLFGGLIFFMRRKKIEPIFYFAVALFVIIEILQMTYFNNYNVLTTLGSIAKIGLAYFAVGITNKRFVDIYVKILYFSAILSLFFYFLTFNPETTNFIIKNIAIHFKPIFGIPHGLRYAYSPNIIIYNYNYEHVAWFRNVGPFWESGAFGVYLNIALILNVIKNKNILNKTNLVLLITIVTTFSTGAYIALFFFMLFYYLIRKDIKHKLIYLIIAGSLSMYGFFSLPFMQQKIEQNIANSDTTTKNRFGSATVDLKVFAMSPIFGLGRSEKTKDQISKKLGVLSHRNNGITGLLSSYGIIVFLLYFISYYYSFLNYIKWHYQYKNANLIAITFLFTIFLIGFSQRIFLYPFFLLFMLYSYYKNTG